MTKIIILPNKDRNYDPSKFEISVENLNADGSYKFYKKFQLQKDFTLDVHLEPKDRIGVEYNRIALEISDNAANTVSAGNWQYFIVPKNTSDPVNIHLQSGVDPQVTSSTIENDLDINIKSFNLKQPFEVKLTPSTGAQTKDQAFWDIINSHQLNFRHYRNFIDEVLTSFPPSKPGSASPASGFKSPNQLADKIYQADKDYDAKKADSKRLPFNRTEAYSLLKYATEKYVEHVYNLSSYLDNDYDKDEKFDLDDYLGNDKIIPYYNLIKSKIQEYFQANPKQQGFLKSHADTILIELIWSYWHEEGMVNQTMIALARRFQNIKNGYRDPLANFALDPLRPLNNILWGYIQDTQHRLTATRRNYEYAGEYNLCVVGNMKPGFNPADVRSKFLQSFHRLIFEATEYFIQSDNTTIRPDGFKLLNALRDTHRILAEGAHNQFGDLPTVARIEMLIEQWILSRSEVREFLGGRIMVPYEEPWMDRVDSMKALQGWDNTSISFYHDLAVYGEKILLGIRNGDWTNVTRRDNATNWADAFRDAIQRYIHSYYTVTGIDLAAKNVSVNAEEKYLQPGILIRQKYVMEKNRRS